MAIANRTTAELQLLQTPLVNGLKALQVYMGDSRNGGLAAGVDTALAAIKVQLDLTIADVTPVTPAENPPI